MIKAFFVRNDGIDIESSFYPIIPFVKKTSEIMRKDYLLLRHIVQELIGLFNIFNPIKTKLLSVISFSLESSSSEY